MAKFKISSHGAWRGQRRRIWRAQDGKCFFCQRYTYLPLRGRTSESQKPFTATLDHIIPVSKGGARNPRLNCVVACRACNRERGDTSFFVFVAQKAVQHG